MSRATSSSEGARLAEDSPRFQRTRSSLVERLQRLEDEQAWREFFDAYWPLIYHVAKRAGMSDEDAEDVVQDTIVKVVKSIGGFDYDREKGSFKGWLRVLARAALVDFCRRQNRQPPRQEPMRGESAEAMLERMVDPGGVELERIWDEEWRENLVHAALSKLKRKVSPGQYQLFLCHCLHEWSVAEVCRALKVNAAQVYMAKYRVAPLFKTEVEALLEKEHETGKTS